MLPEDPHPTDTVNNAVDIHPRIRFLFRYASELFYQFQHIHRCNPPDVSQDQDPPFAYGDIH